MELSIQGLSKCYGGNVQALDDVSLTIGAGLFGLLGPNGAGKSTLMRTLATLQEADSGTVRLNGIDGLRDKESIRGRLGYLPQEFGLYPKVTAYEMLDHLAACKGIGPARKRGGEVIALLQRTNLFEVRHRKLGTFSGGMKQRFGIAQALLGRPQLVIVDEPTAGLDPEERARCNNLLADIGEEIIVILSTHIVADVSDLCPRMAVINKGRVVLTGEPGEVAAALAGRIWRKTVRREDVAEYERTHGERFPILRKAAIAGKIGIHVHADQAPDAGFEPVTPDLEDAYFWAIRQSQLAPAPAAAPARA